MKWKCDSNAGDLSGQFRNCSRHDRVSDLTQLAGLQSKNSIERWKYVQCSGLASDWDDEINYATGSVRTRVSGRCDGQKRGRVNLQRWSRSFLQASYQPEAVHLVPRALNQTGIGALDGGGLALTSLSALMLTKSRWESFKKVGMSTDSPAAKAVPSESSSAVLQVPSSVTNACMTNDSCQHWGKDHQVLGTMDSYQIPTLT
jgi:hypothetical protein